MTFKQYLREEDEADQEHERVEDAAREYLLHCRQFPDVDTPLYRLSGESWQRNPNHKLKTRVPRTRKSNSIGGTAEEQEFLFSLPGWGDFPRRRQSIFCSTTRNFMIDSPSEDGGNLLMIYPFDGVKIAVLPEIDLNTMNILRGVKSTKIFKTIGDLFEPIDRAYLVFYGTDYDTAKDPGDKYALIKMVFSKGGKFDPGANGNDELADKYAELARAGEVEAEMLRLVAGEFQRAISPEGVGVRLVPSSGLDLPGEARECWFSGKYLSVPYRYHKEFKRAVRELADS